MTPTTPEIIHYLANKEREHIPPTGQLYYGTDHHVMRLLQLTEIFYGITYEPNNDNLFNPNVFRWARRARHESGEDEHNIEQELHNNEEVFEERLYRLEQISGLPHNGTLNTRLTTCCDQLYGNIEGNWFLTQGVVITTETQALQNLELTLGIASPAEGNCTRLSNIEHHLGLHNDLWKFSIQFDHFVNNTMPTTPCFFIHRLQKIIKHVYLPKNHPSIWQYSWRTFLHEGYVIGVSDNPAVHIIEYQMEQNIFNLDYDDDDNDVP